MKDKRKVFQYSKSAINALSEYSAFEAILFGKPAKDSQLNIPFKYIGNVPYNMSTKLFLQQMLCSTSVEENLSNTVFESLVCGTPCVAFNIGGMSDMIVHKENGYLAKPFDADDLAGVLNGLLIRGSKGENFT